MDFVINLYLLVKIWRTKQGQGLTKVEPYLLFSSSLLVNKRLLQICTNITCTWTILCVGHSDDPALPLYDTPLVSLQKFVDVASYLMHMTLSRHSPLRLVLWCNKFTFACAFESIIIMREIVCFMDKFAPSSEDAMQEDQGTLLMCKHKVNLLPKLARTKMQCQDPCTILRHSLPFSL
jgi:hypothetical protein